MLLGRMMNQLFYFAASTPVLLQITPILGALIGVVSALMLVAVIIVVVIRLRGGDGNDDKDCDEGGISSSSRHGGAGGDKASTEPLNKDLNDSVDSLEEKNPDIIPQNNAEDDYQDEERAFERLNNASVRTYSRLQSPSNPGRNSCYDTYKPQKSVSSYFTNPCDEHFDYFILNRYFRMKLLMLNFLCQTNKYLMLFTINKRYQCLSYAVRNL